VRPPDNVQELSDGRDRATHAAGLGHLVAKF